MRYILIIIFLVSSVQGSSQDARTIRTDGYYFFVDTQHGFTRMLFFGTNNQYLDTIVYGATPILTRMPPSGNNQVYEVSSEKQGVLIKLLASNPGPDESCEHCKEEWRIHFLDDGFRVSDIRTDKKKWQKVSEFYLFQPY